MTEQEERFWYGATNKEIEEAYQKAKMELLIGLQNTKGEEAKLEYLRAEATKQGFVFSNNPYQALPDIKELCNFFEIEESDLDEEAAEIKRMATPQGL